MFHFLSKYSPDYAKNNLEGWSVVLVLAVGIAASTLDNSWLAMFGLFVAGVFCAHVLAFVIKYLITKNTSNPVLNKSKYQQ